MLGNVYTSTPIVDYGLMVVDISVEYKLRILHESLPDWPVLTVVWQRPTRQELQLTLAIIWILRDVNTVRMDFCSSSSKRRGSLVHVSLMKVVMAVVVV